MRTNKKIKYIGVKKYLVRDLETGEERVEEMSIASIEDRDFNFTKIWLTHILQLIDELGGAKFKVVQYLLENRTAENIVFASISEISKATGISQKTIQVTLKILKQQDIIRQKTAQGGAYQFNPSVIFKGTRGNRMNVLLQYSKTNAEPESKQPESDSDSTEKQTA